VRRTRPAYALLVLLAACRSAALPTPGSPSPLDPADALARGPLTFVSARSIVEGDAFEEITFRDARGGGHVLNLHYTSYPIVVTSVTIDGEAVPQGASWGRLGTRLVEAGVSNNATFMLRCFGGAQRC
jgi:hypothetical protein